MRHAATNYLIITIVLFLSSNLLAQDKLLNDAHSTEFTSPSENNRRLIDPVAPVLIAPIGDLTLEEDFIPFTVADLDEVFSDPDGGPLTYSVGLNGPMGATIIPLENSLILVALANASGEAEVIVSAFDEELLSVSDTFLVHIAAVNDAPAAASLISPGDGTFFELEEQIEFRWRSATDVDDELLLYSLSIAGENLDTVLVENPDTTYILEIDQVLEDDASYSWSVQVFDGELRTFSSDTFAFSIRINSLQPPFLDQFELPGEPNPEIWFTSNTDVNDGALDPPSGPFSLNLNGMPDGGDIITSRPIEMQDFTFNASLRYSYQPQGTLDAPEEEDSLMVFFKNNLGEWIRVRAYPGSPLTVFRQEVIMFEAEPSGDGHYFHDDFQVRFQSIGGASPSFPNDNWFIDNFDITMETLAIEGASALPREFELLQNFPNPFNPTTVIRYSLPVTRDMMLEIYDIAGRRIKTVINDQQSAGIHEFVWDGTDDAGRRVVSGMYLYRMQAGDHFMQVRKMVLLR